MLFAAHVKNLSRMKLILTEVLLQLFSSLIHLASAQTSLAQAPSTILIAQIHKANQRLKLIVIRKKNKG
jgi:hypothetical protein